MGELVAWGLGLILGYSVRNKLTARRPILLFLIAVAVIFAMNWKTEGKWKAVRTAVWQLLTGW